MKIKLVLIFMALGTFVYGGELIPKPVKQSLGSGSFNVTQSTLIVIEDYLYLDLADYLNSFLTPSLAAPLRVTSQDKGLNYIRLTIAPHASLPAEGYRLSVNEHGVSVMGMDRGGLFNGIQTLLQLFPQQIYTKSVRVALTLPVQEIEDYPCFAYRGMMLDVARTFTDVAGVKRFIDNIAYHKLNKFHWHLTDDEGWRVEIKALPELTSIGGFRGGDSPVKPIYGLWDKKYGGYYTQDQIRDVVEYALERNIEIIPEIELPGHGRTVAKVYPHILCAGQVDTVASGDDRRNVWCVAKEANYAMVETIIREISALFPSRYIHIGGDEVDLSAWKACPDCQKLVRSKHLNLTANLEDYFMDKVAGIVKKYHKIPVGWNEIASSGKFTKDSRAYVWQGVKELMDVTAKGYKTVVMPGSYFYIDMKQSPTETGLTWAGIVTTKRLYSFGFEKQGLDPQKMDNIVGIQGGFWAELLLSNGPSYLDYQLFPRICALSEVAWSAEKSRSWDDFYGRLTSDHMGRLKAMGIEYRAFPPKVDYSKGVITVVKPHDGCDIRYTTDGSEPNIGSMIYTRPIYDKIIKNYLFRSFYNGVASPAVSATAKTQRKIEALQTQTFDIELPEIVDVDGIWYFRVRTTDTQMNITKITVNSPDTSYMIINYPQAVNESRRLRFYADPKSRSGVMSITIKNMSKQDCDLVFEFEPSPYIEPNTKVSSTMTQNTRFPFSNIEDYNHSTYTRTNATCSVGDYVSYTFDQAISAESIEIITGLDYLPRYHLIKGHVEVSGDGVNFVVLGQLVNGKVTIYPDNMVKAVRVVSDSDGNSEAAVAFNDLLIKPRIR